MCLIAFAYQVHEKYPLILIANRDEFYARPTEPAHQWANFPTIVAGKDLKAGGTWMAVSKGGKWGALTNYRNPDHFNPDAPTRGNLILDFLNKGSSPYDYLKEIRASGKQYNGFNLLLGDRNSVVHYSNVSNKINEIQPGIHGVSNALLDTPWSKLVEAKTNLKNCINQPLIQKESLFKIMADETTAPDLELPSTGLDLEKERAVSSIFVRTSDYGTRCSSILLIDHKGKIDFTERSFDSTTKTITNEVAFHL